MTKLTEFVVGFWKLNRVYFIDNKGIETDYFGKSPLGLLCYDNLGNMCAQIMKPERTLFSSADFDGGTDKEVVEAFRGYQAYFGKYFFKNEGLIVHDIFSAIIPNWVNTQEERFIKVINNNELQISTPPIKIRGNEFVFMAHWIRMKAENESFR